MRCSLTLQYCNMTHIMLPLPFLQDSIFYLYLCFFPMQQAQESAPRGLKIVLSHQTCSGPSSVRKVPWYVFQVVHHEASNYKAVDAFPQNWVGRYQLSHEESLCQLNVKLTRCLDFALHEDIALSCCVFFQAVFSGYVTVKSAMSGSNALFIRLIWRCSSGIADWRDSSPVL